MKSPPVYVTAVAARTPVGDGAAQTASSIRARLSRYVRHEFLQARAARPEWEDDDALVVASAPGIDPETNGPERLSSLLRAAFAELFDAADFRRKDLQRTALSLALPRPTGVVARWMLRDAFVPDILRRTGLSFASVTVSESGHAGMFAAAAEAARLVASGAAPAAIVAGVDSWLDPDRLVELDKGYRAKSSRNVDGFVPGEAATAFLLERAGGPRPSLAVLCHPTVASEPAPSTGDRQSTGAGLCSAVRGALSGYEGRVAWVLCDLNGESYRGFEWGILRTRLGPRFADDVELSHPAECHGDVGAATGGALVATVCAAFERGWAPAPDALAWCASDDELRAALRLSRS